MVRSPSAHPTHRITLGTGGGHPGWWVVGLLTIIGGVFLATNYLVARHVPGAEPFFDTSLRTDRLVVALAASLPWLLMMGFVRFVRQPRRPLPGPATQDLPPEPPALANMLVNDFEPTKEILPATVIDLAARGHLDIEEAGQDRYQLRVRRRAATDLFPYEQRVMDLLRWKQSGGVVPAEALTTGPTQQAKAWWKDFRKQIIAEGKARGLTEDLWSPGVVALLLFLAAPAAFVWWWAVGEWIATMWFFFLVFAIISTIREGERQRHSPAGLEAASRWLGVRQFHREGAFDDLPPTAVTIWERHMSYAAALGVARNAIRAIPMGADDDHRAWSQMGGQWRLVRVRYPLLWPPAWGRAPVFALLIGLAASFVSLAVLFGISRLWSALAAESTSSAPILPADAIPVARLVLLVVAAVAGLFLLRSLLLTMLAISDLGSERQLTGIVLRMRAFGGDENSQPRHYIAIDDGSTDEVRALRMRGIPYAGLSEGAIATAAVTPRLGHLRRLTATK